MLDQQTNPVVAAVLGQAPPAPHEAPARSDGLTLDSAIGQYLKLREARSELKRAYEEEDSKMKMLMSRLEVSLLASLDAAGVESLRTASGTVFCQTKSKPVCGDWNALYDHILNTRSMNLLWKRLSEREILDVFEETGALPPGVTVTQERVAIVRVK